MDSEKRSASGVSDGARAASEQLINLRYLSNHASALAAASRGSLLGEEQQKTLLSVLSSPELDVGQSCRAARLLQASGLIHELDPEAAGAVLRRLYSTILAAATQSIVDCADDARDSALNDALRILSEMAEDNHRRAVVERPSSENDGATSALSGEEALRPAQDLKTESDTNPNRAQRKRKPSVRAPFLFDMQAAGNGASRAPIANRRKIKKPRPVIKAPEPDPTTYSVLFAQPCDIAKDTPCVAPVEGMNTLPCIFSADEDPCHTAVRGEFQLNEVCICDSCRSDPRRRICKGFFMDQQNTVHEGVAVAEDLPQKSSAYRFLHYNARILSFKKLERHCHVVSFEKCMQLETFNRYYKEGGSRCGRYNRNERIIAWEESARVIYLKHMSKMGGQ